MHISTPLEIVLTNALNVLNADEEKEIEDFLKELDASKEVHLMEAKIEELKYEPMKDDTKFELKVLPSHLKYVFLKERSNKLFIINNSLSFHEEPNLIQVLKPNKKAVGWVLSELKGINP